MVRRRSFCAGCSTFLPTNPGQIGGWLFIIGSILFLWKSIHDEKLFYEHEWFLNIDFVKPLSLGSFLYLTGSVFFTLDTYGIGGPSLSSSASGETVRGRTREAKRRSPRPSSGRDENGRKSSDGERRRLLDGRGASQEPVFILRKA